MRGTGMAWLGWGHHLGAFLEFRQVGWHTGRADRYTRQQCRHRTSVRSCPGRFCNQDSRRQLLSHQLIQHGMVTHTCNLLVASKTM